MRTEQHESTKTTEILSPALVEILKPQETAIIVVDVMNSYFDQNEILAKTVVHSGTTYLQETAKKIGEFLEASRKYPIATTVFARMIERPDAMPENFRYKMEEVDDTPPLVEVGGPGWNYYGVAPREGDHEVTKVHYNAFTGTDLDKHLKAKGVKTLVIIGGYGSICVASTAIVAADTLGYNVVIPKDLVANLDKNRSEVPAFLQAFDSAWGYARSSEAILNTWGKSSK